MSSNSDQSPRTGQKPDPASQKHEKPGFLQVTHSVLAAIFGVQSAENRERDFKKGQASDYIAIYVIIVIALVVGMIVTVNMVLSSAGQ